MSFFNKYKEKFKQHIDTKRVESKAINKIRDEERFKQKLQTARHQEKIRGERQRKYAASGGTFGQIMKIADVATRPKPKQIAAVRKTKGKKGRKKAYKKQMPPQQPQRPSMMDFRIPI